MKMEQIECSEMSAYKIQTPGNHPEENIQHSKTLAARHGRGTAWARHAMCESVFISLLSVTTKGR
jgi:hypothetical protein